MKIFDTKDIREIDAYTIRNEPVSSADLMERAANACADWIVENLDRNSEFVIFTGPGNNGGDGWAIARILINKGIQYVRLFHLQISEIISPDAEFNRNRLIQQQRVPVMSIRSSRDFPQLQHTCVVIDALFGSGLSRSLEGLSLELVKHINASGCRIVSVDVPSGLFGEDNCKNSSEGVIHADDTLTFQFPKRAFFFSENEIYTGNWHVLPIGLHADIISEKQSGYFYTVFDDITGKIKKRKKFSHKGLQGHALLIAGSYGMMGAAILASKSCLRTGAGLLTTHVPLLGYPIVQTAVPECIFSIDKDEHCFSETLSYNKFSAVGLGPGIGIHSESSPAIINLIKTIDKPLIIDADGLNFLSLHPDWLDLLPRRTILTPHPGEFDRLAGKSSCGFSRNQRQIELSKKHQIIILLKGAYSSITLPDGKCYYNSTGNPGMATAGAGDVLTGMILSLLTQGYEPEEAAIIGAFIHGLAGDLAVIQNGHALIASDIIDQIGNAFKTILNYDKVS